MSYRYLLILWLLSSLFALSTGQAQTTYAVIIGISDYAISNSTNGDLHFADDDARLFASLLQSPAGGSVSLHNIVLLTEQQATRSNIIWAMQIFQKATERDRVIFFFSGHGDHGFLVPYDAGPGVVLWHDDVKNAFRQSTAKTKLLIADACKSGSLEQPNQPVPRTVPVSGNNANIVVIMSSRSNQLSQETSRLSHGVFTYFLVQGAAGAADINHDRVITMEELYVYMRRMIQSFTNNHQTPVIYGRFPVKMPFTYTGS